MPSRPDTAGPAVVECDAGRITGTASAGVRRFLGIPYALPPVGARRFGLPEPAPAAEVAADAFGPTSPAAMVLPEPFTYPEIPGDDWLTLNIWAPATPGTGLPVLVWIHGGSFAMGSTAQTIFDGTSFARDGVVFVSVNHRIGVEGFAHLPDAPDNRGLRDQICALEWVQRNIAAFGGDPARVTLAGESAGAMSASALAVTPHAGSLFARAICQSGIASAYPADVAARSALIAAEQLGCSPTAADLQRIDPREVAAAVAAVVAGMPPHRQATLFVPALGDLLPERPDRVLARDRAAIPMIIGHNAAEADLWCTPGVFPPDQSEEATAAWIAEELGILGATPEIVDAYRGSSGQPFVDLVSDGLFAAPSLRAQRGQGENCYAYLFSWPSPLLSRTAFHALDLGFALGNLDDPAFRLHAGTAPPTDLRDAMHGAWVAFCRDGSPASQWRPYRDERDLHVFGPRATRNVELLEAWG
ncbi:carboxylesterase/lipase family protein [Tsukamurella strandjordii]|uniref:carboxylesterase/lipase family protein n=1 Tax=Tsukamurella strandjordii TaxID=147577 RepID=UPI0031DA4AB1